MPARAVRRKPRPSIPPVVASPRAVGDVARLARAGAAGPRVDAGQVGVLVCVGDAPTSPRKAAGHVLANGVVRLLVPPVERQLPGVRRASNVAPVHRLDTAAATRAAGHAIDAVGRTRAPGVTRAQVLVATLGLQITLACEVRAGRPPPAARPGHRRVGTPDRGVARVQEGVGRPPIGGRTVKGAVTDPTWLGPPPDRPASALLRHAHQATAPTNGQTEVTHPGGEPIGPPDRPKDLTGRLREHDEVPVPVIVEGERLNRQVRRADAPVPTGAATRGARPARVGRVSPSEVAHGVVLTQIQEEKVPLAVDAVPEGAPQARPGRRNEVKAATGPLLTMPEVHPSQAGSALVARPFEHPIGPVGVAEVPHVLEATPRGRPTQMAPPTLRRVGTATPDAAPPSSGTLKGEVRPVIGAVRAPPASVAHVTPLPRHLRTVPAQSRAR